MTVDLSLNVVVAPIRAQVEEKLRLAIVDGRFLPGEHLSDRELSGIFKVSRTVIREAVRRLEAEGLVTSIPHRGQFVSIVSADEASQIYAVRGVLEGLAGKGFAENATDAQMEQLRKIFEELVSANKTAAGGGALLAIKRRFYDVLLSGCGNAYVTRMLNQMLNKNSQLRATSLSVSGRLQDTITEIRLILHAIELRAPEEAWKACVDHVRKAGEVAVAILREREKSIHGNDKKEVASTNGYTFP
jgi:DNA-binding GntR family transcriptional regulator